MRKPDVKHRITNCQECSSPLRSDNASGYCKKHKHKMRNQCAMCGAPCQMQSKHCARCALMRHQRPQITCQFEGCETVLSENTVTGFCRPHSFQAKKCAYDGCTKRMSSWNVTDYCTEHYRYGRKLNDPRPKNPWLWPTTKIKVLKADKAILQNIALCPADERRELPVDAIPWGFRAREAIKALECTTLGQLESVNINRLGRMADVGRSTVMEIVSRMRAIKLIPKIPRRKVGWSKSRRAKWEKKKAAKQTGESADAN